MFKMMGGVFIGVFLGAFLMEVLSRRSPHILKDVEAKAKRTARAAADAFSEGYRGTPAHSE